MLLINHRGTLRFHVLSGWRSISMSRLSLQMNSQYDANVWCNIPEQMHRGSSFMILIKLFLFPKLIREETSLHPSQSLCKQLSGTELAPLAPCDLEIVSWANVESRTPPLSELCPHTAFRHVLCWFHFAFFEKEIKKTVMSRYISSKDSRLRTSPQAPRLLIYIWVPSRGRVGELHRASAWHERAGIMSFICRGLTAPKW